LCHLTQDTHENLLVGIETSDDAAVYKITDDIAIVQTLDFFTPVVDDPYVYGQIAAANSLSDIYAMGAEPKLALNIICFSENLPKETINAILKGGHDKVKEAGALIVGGHTVDDNEPKYGLSVTGFMHPDDVVTNCNAKAGDVLILTKPIGIGVLNTGIKSEMISEEGYRLAVETMSTLNKFAKNAMMKVGVNSCTDVTGFGLLGHAYEMAKGSDVTIKIQSKSIPIIQEALSLAKMGIIPAGAYKNMNYIKDFVRISNQIPQELVDCMYDPQTSGGLLISLDKGKAEMLLTELQDSPTPYALIGEVLAKDIYSIIVE
jgi:selenide, water dikinase